MAKVQKDKLYVIPNPDKTLHQKWGDTDHPITDLFNFPRPYGMLLNAQPNCGKTLMIKNILVHMKPIPKNIFILHCETFDPEVTGTEDKDIINDELDCIPEYKGIKAVFLKSFPPITFWDQFKNEHNLLIIDDVNLRSWCSAIRSRLTTVDKTFSWCRTHRNLTIICGFQSLFQQCPQSVYRYVNIFILWKIRDKFVQSMLGRITGIDNDCWKKVFNLCKSQYDNITIDTTPGSPALLRFNVVKPIEYRNVCDLTETKIYESSDEED